MEVLLTVVLLGFGAWLWSLRAELRRIRTELWETSSQLASIKGWSHGFYRDVQALRGQLDAMSRRLDSLEASTLVPPTAHATETANAQVVVHATEAARAEVSAQATEAAHAEVSAQAPEVTAPTREVTEPPASIVSEPTNEVDVPAAPASDPAIAARAATEPVAEVETVAADPRATTAFATSGEPASVPEAKVVAPANAKHDSEEFRPKFDWENLIGVRLFSWIAGISLLLGAVFFLRYSAESGWLSPTVRMSMGLLLGITLLAACEWKGRDYRITANAMDAAGIGTLFATSFAGNAVWHLIPSTVAFLLLILVTTVAVLLSIRRNSVFIALLGLVGGFATPILLSSGENHPIGLFGYLMLLNAGLGYLGYRQRWPVLLALSVGLTTVYQWGWVARFVLGDATQMVIAAGVFLVFPVAWVGMNALFDRRRDLAPPWVAEMFAWVAAMPLVFAVAMAWVPAFGERYLLLFGYLFVLDVGLLGLDHYRPKTQLSLVAALATNLIWLEWLLRHSLHQAWPSVPFILAAFVALFLLAYVLRIRASVGPAHFRLASSTLLVAFAILPLTEPATASPYLLFGVLLVLFLAIASVAVWASDGWLYYLAACMVLVAQASWSARFMSPTTLLPALLVYVAFAMALIFVPSVARRYKKTLTPATLASVIAPANLTLVFFMTFGVVAQRSLWMLGVLITLLNIGAFIEARHSGKHQAAFVGIGLSWLSVVCWWTSAMAPERLLSGLVVMLALVLLSMGGILWLKLGKESKTSAPLLEQGPFLGLVGHLFLLFVASQSSLGVPPWSFFAVLLILDLAMIASSLHLGNALFGSVALAMTVLILAVWSVAAQAQLGPLNVSEVALVAVLLVAGLASGLPAAAYKRGLTMASFLLSREVLLLICQASVVVFGALSSPPHLVAMVLGQLLLMGLILYHSGIRGHSKLMFVSWVLGCACVLAWSLPHLDADNWWHILLMALVPYALFTAYPVLQHRAGMVGRWPFVLATCGALSMFAFGYLGMRLGPLSGYLGALPLVLSIVTAGMLVFLLRVVEPSGPKDIGRIALVAAIALGFATTAIPLQLENEWLTIAWALEAAAVGWLYGRLRHVGLIAASFALATAVTARLAVNPEVFVYHAHTATPLLNFYLYSYLVSSSALYLASYFIKKPEETKYPWLNVTPPVQRAFATLLLFVLLNIEIADYYSKGDEIEFRFSSTIAQDLTYTLGWALFAIGMLIAGIVLRGRAARIAALVLLTVTIAKCFLHDLWRLGGLYRVGSFVGLALCLALVAIMLQRFVLRPNRAEAGS